MKRKVEVSVQRTVTAMEWLTDENQIHYIVGELVRMAEGSKGWRVGKAIKTTATVSGHTLELALDFTRKGYKAFIASKGELILEPAE